jgi:hypothetical protein
MPEGVERSVIAGFTVLVVWKVQLFSQLAKTDQ